LGNSLKDQLLKLGIVNEKRAKQVSQQERQKNKQKRSAPPTPEQDEERRMWAQLEAEKVARDRELNRQRQEQAERKAVAAQIRQLIETHRLTKTEGEITFNFVEGSKVKRLYVTEAIQQQLANGRLAITRLNGRHELIPGAIGEKILERDPNYPVILAVPKGGAETAEEDPYAAYQVPDDLMW